MTDRPGPAPAVRVPAPPVPPPPPAPAGYPALPVGPPAAYVDVLTGDGGQRPQL